MEAHNQRYHMVYVPISTIGIIFCIHEDAADGSSGVPVGFLFGFPVIRPVPIRYGRFNAVLIAFVKNGFQRHHGCIE